jgi:hypothetical protein
MTISLEGTATGPTAEQRRAAAAALEALGDTPGFAKQLAELDSIANWQRDDNVRSDRSLLESRPVRRPPGVGGASGEDDDFAKAETTWDEKLERAARAVGSRLGVLHEDLAKAESALVDVTAALQKAESAREYAKADELRRSKQVLEKAVYGDRGNDPSRLQYGDTDDDSDDDGLSKAEAALLRLADTRSAIRKADATPGERARVEGHARDGVRALGHELMMQRSEGYREVVRTRALGGSLS